MIRKEFYFFILFFIAFKRLNEGFATLYEYYFVHLTYPEGRYDDSFLVDTLQRVLEVDANPNIRPMSLYVEDPVSIDFLFDWVAYSKCKSKKILNFKF